MSTMTDNQKNKIIFKQIKLRSVGIKVQNLLLDIQLNGLIEQPIKLSLGESQVKKKISFQMKIKLKIYKSIFINYSLVQIRLSFDLKFY